MSAPTDNRNSAYPSLGAAKRAMSTAYVDLLDRLQPNEPRGGWNERNLPRLTDTDLADCLAEYPDLIDDVQCDARTLAECWWQVPIAAGITANEYLGMVYRTQIAQAARRRICADLRDRAEDRELAAYEAGVLAEAL